MSCFYFRAGGQTGIFRLLALIASIVYAPFCLSTYFLQLTVVALNPRLSSSTVLDLIGFKPGSPTFAPDMMGYGFLCLSTLAAGFALREAKDRVLRALCFFHGALVVPAIASPMMSGAFLSTSGGTDNTGNYVLIFWCVVLYQLPRCLRDSSKKSPGALPPPGGSGPVPSLSDAWAPNRLRNNPFVV